MAILAHNTKLIKVGQDYSAGAGISIDDHVISVTGGLGTTYSAGDNIDIYEQDEQLYISSKDWSEDIANASANAYNAATAQIPEPQDLSYISSKVDDKLDTTAFTAWQSGQYATDLQTIEGQITNKLDTSSFSDVSGSFLTAINIPESATWNEVSTTVQSNSAQWAEGGSGDEEVNSFVYNNSATINDVNTSYQTNSGDFLTAAPADMATTGDIADLTQSISETYYPNTNPSSFVGSGWVTAQGYITGVDLSEYAKRDFVLSSIESATSGKLDVSSFSTVSSDFLINEDLNGYATTAWVDEQGYLTAHQDISNKLDTTAFSDVSGDFLTTSFGISESGAWNDTTNVVQTNSSNWGSEFDPTYMSAQIDNKLNKSEISFRKWGVDYVTAISGKELSARYAVTARNANIATTAIYDENGNNLTYTYNNLTALNEFVRSNSASWGQGGGGGADIAPLGLWLGFEYYYPKAINNTNNAYSITLRNTQWEEPQSIYYEGNSYNWNGTNGDWYIDLTTIYHNDMIGNLPYNDAYETNFTVMEFTNTNSQEKYSANISINTNENTKSLSVNNSACVVSARGQVASYHVDYFDGMGGYLVSSWQGTYDYTSGGFTNSQATTFYLGVSDASDSTAYIGFAVEAGSTVASGDVFPPTNNLYPYITYYLGWNANNGGLQWFS